MPAPTQTSAASAVRLVASETDELAGAIAADGETIDRALDAIAGARRVFVHGAGRSGLALRGLAMRLMHLGLDAHVVGETTTPAIGAGDVLVAASGSGTTAGVVAAAETAVGAGASVVAISTTDDAPLAALAAVTVLVPAATKTDRSGTASAQYAGSLFEQGVSLVGDAAFHALWARSGAAAEELWPRHANLE